MKKSLRLGIIGLGSIGLTYARKIVAGNVPGCELAALCNRSGSGAKEFPSIPLFRDAGELICSGSVDAVLIATPHFSHPAIGAEALAAGLHVLMEKPLGVSKSACEQLLAAHRGQVFAAMFNQRTDPCYLAIRRMVREGEIGTVRRINWIITDWFRTDAYYNSGSWRATWKGEGGGLIVNQLPHNLDLLQWIFGMPSSVRASCLFGHHHAIEVEDEVSAFFDYHDGASAVIVSSTGESPGTNRLEVAGDLGKLVLEGDRLTFHRNAVSMREFSRTSKEGFAKPPCSVEVIEFPDRGGDQHVAILRNFTAAVLYGEPLIAPATEGIHSVELGNAMLLSSIKDMTVRLPINVQDFDNCLNILMEKAAPKSD